MIYALMGLLGFGLADYVIVYLTKSAGYLRGLFWNTFFLLLYLLVFLLVFGGGENILALSNTEYIISLTAGIVASLGTLAFYKGTQEGNISILSPIASTYSVIIVLFSVVFLSEKLLPLQVVSIVIVIIGTLLISTNLREVKKFNISTSDKSVPYGLVAMFLWGISFILIGDMSIKIGWLETDILISLASFIFLSIYVFCREKRFVCDKKKAYAQAALVGVFTTMGYVGYSVGVTSTYASIVAPIVAASPLVTVILALIFLKEKLAFEQKVGVLVLILGLVALSV